MRQIFPMMFLLLLSLSACNASSPTEVVAIPETGTGTYTMTSTWTPTRMPETPTFAATPQLFPGTIRIKVNVRAGPGTSYDSLGLLDVGQVVQVISISADGNWYRIMYPGSEDGFGWVTSQYVAFSEGTPVFPTSTQGSGTGLMTGRVLQRLNVRSGPGVSFDSLGTLEEDTSIFLVAKNSTASWFQIEYPPGTSGRGWITAQFVQVVSSGSLPVVDEFGRPILTGTPGPTMIPRTATPTVGPARSDGDSQANPAIKITFLPGGTTRFSYTSQVSLPEGDEEDWLEFIPYASMPGMNSRLNFSLVCSGNGTLMVELLRDGEQVDLTERIECGHAVMITTLPAGVVYQVRLSLIPGQGLQLVDYQISVENLP